MRPALIALFLAAALNSSPPSVHAQIDCLEPGTMSARLDSLALNGEVLGLVDHGDRFAYMTRGTGDLGFEVVLGTVSPTGDITVESTYQGANGIPVTMTMAGDLVAVALTAEGALPTGWTLIDFSIPAVPDTASFIPLSSEPRPGTIHMEGNLLGIGTETGEFRFYDISVPTDPQGTSTLAERRANSVTTYNGIWYVTTQGTYIRAYDLTDPAAPALVASHWMQSDLGMDIFRSYRNLVVEDGILAVVLFDQYIHKSAQIADTNWIVEIFDVSNPSALALVKRWSYGLDFVGDLGLADGTLFVAIESSVDFIPAETWQTAMTISTAGPPALTNPAGKLLVADDDGLQLWQSSFPSPVIIGQGLVGELGGRSMKVVDEKAFVTRHRERWYDSWPEAQYVVFDLSQPQAPVIIAEGTFSGPAEYPIEISPLLDATAVLGNVLYKNVHFFDGETMGIATYAFDWTTGARGPRLLDEPFTDGVAVGDALYLLVNGQLLVYDASDPMVPDLRASLDVSSGTPTILAAGRDYLDVVGLSIKRYDITDPLNPIFLASANSSPFRPVTARSVGNRLYVAGGDLLRIYRYVHGSLTALSAVTISGPRDVAVVGTHAYVVDAQGATQIVNVAEAANPFIVGRIDTREPPIAVETTDEAVINLGGNLLNVISRACNAPGNLVPEAQVVPPTLDFGATPTASERVVVVSNIGDGVLTVDPSLICEAGEGLTMIPPTDPVHLAGGESAEIRILYEPEGLAPGTVSTCTILPGIGIPPVPITAEARDFITSWSATDSLDFGLVPTDRTVILEAILTNTGEMELALDVALAEGSGAFTITGSGPVALAPAAQHLVEVTFAPDEVGEALDSITWGQDLPATSLRGTGRSSEILVFQPEQMEFPLTPVGLAKTDTIRIRNLDTVARTVTPVVVPAEGPFSMIGSGTPLTIAADATTVLEVVFQPGAVGTFQGRVSVEGYLSGVDLSGVGYVPGPECLASADTLVFTPDGLGASQHQTLTILNSGERPLEITASTDRPEFAVPPADAQVVAPGDSLRLEITFTPTSATEVHGRLDLGSDECATIHLVGRPTSAILLNRTALLPNIPNPFNPETRLRFTMAEPGRARIRIFDIAGRLVRVILDDSRPAGLNEESWNGRDGSGRAVASGPYYVQLEAGGVTDLRKVMLVR